MFIGHYAVGFGGRGARPIRHRQPSLGTWFLAVQWLDLVWPILVMSGIERIRIVSSADPFLNVDFTYYPWTHSLLAALVWAAIFATIYGWRTKNGAAALLLGGAVLSHWVLDLIVHVPDLPLFPRGTAKLGFGLWRSAPATIVVEMGMFVLALVWYVRRTRALDGVGRWALRALVAFLLVVYVASLLSPPPPSEMAVGASGLLLWLLVPWAYWIDRHRAEA